MISLRTQGTLDIYCLLVTHYRVLLCAACGGTAIYARQGTRYLVMGTLHKFRLLLLFVLGKTRNNNITKGSALYTAHSAHTFDVSIYAEPLYGYIVHSSRDFIFHFGK